MPIKISLYCVLNKSKAKGSDFQKGAGLMRPCFEKQYNFSYIFSNIIHKNLSQERRSWKLFCYETKIILGPALEVKKLNNAKERN